MTLVVRLALTTALAASALVLGSTALALRAVHRERLAEQREAAESVAASWAEVLAREIPRESLATRSDALDAWPSDHLHESAATLFVPHASADSLVPVAWSEADEPHLATETERTAWRTGRAVTTLLNGAAPAWRLAVPIRDGGDGRSPPRGILAVTLPLGDLRASEERERRQILGMALAAALAAAGVSVLLVRSWLVRPLARLGVTLAAGTAAHDTSATPVADETGPHEVRSLAAAFNRLRAALIDREREGAARAALAERAERARLLDRVAVMEETGAGFAHDVGTPLNTIRGHLQLLRDDLALGHAAAATQRLPTVLAQVDRVAESVRRRLAEGSWPRPLIGDHELRGLARRLLDFVTPDLHARGLTAVLADGPPVHVTCDPDLVEQIGLTLLRNAAEALGDGGGIVLRTGTDGSTGWLEIADDGPGVPEAVQTHLFQPFVTTKGSAGTGLGLAVARRLARSLDGDLTLQPAPRGATWRLALPRTSA